MLELQDTASTLQPNHAAPTFTKPTPDPPSSKLPTDKTSKHQKCHRSIVHQTVLHRKIGHVFDDLKTGSLTSIGQLCDDDSVALFDKHNVKIYKNGRAIIVGTRNTTNGLWNIPLAPKTMTPPPANAVSPSITCHSAKGAIQNVVAKQDLAAFLHACTFSPTPSTFLQAVHRGHFSSWPGLTASLLTKHLPKSLAASKSHLRTQQQNIQPTKITTNLPLATSLDFSSSQEPNNGADANI
jgi:hypothetical protein